MTTAVPPPANGHARPVTLEPLRLPEHGPVSGWPQGDPGQPCKDDRNLTPDDPGQSRTAANEPERRRRSDGMAFIVVALFAVAQVAVVAFSGSWQHQYELSVHLGQAHWVAGMQPLSVEGLIASATLVIWYAARYKCGSPLGAYLVLSAGVGQTVLMNLGADYRWPWLGPEISVWPAVAFVAAYEMAVWLVRKRQEVAARHDGGQDKVAAGIADSPDSGADNPGDRTADSRPDKAAGKMPSRKVMSRTGRDRAADIIRRNPGWDNAKVAGQAGCDVRTVRRARSDLAGREPS
jgi:nitrate reductase NapE component